MQKNTMSAKDSKIAVALNPRVSLLVSVKKKLGLDSVRLSYYSHAHIN